MKKKKTVSGFVATLVNPDNIGTSEYRSIHELLKDAESLDVAEAILAEFSGWASGLQTKLSQYRRE